VSHVTTSAAPPVIVHSGPVIIHTAPVVHVSDTPTTVIAALGLLAAVASLAWQTWSFRRSGSRVRVNIVRGLAGVGHAITIPWDATQGQLAQMHRQGYTDPIYVVTAVNSGRGEASVVSADVLLPGGGSVSETRLDPPLPFRLAGSSEQSWRFDARLVDGYMQVFDTALQEAESRVARGRIRLGGQDEAILSKNEIELSPS
jgi:hypothetical protein